MNLNIAASNIQNDQNFSTSIQPSSSENCQKSHDSSDQKQLIASCMGADIIEPTFNKYSNSKTFSRITHKKQIVTNVFVKPEKLIQNSKQIHASHFDNVQNRCYNGTNTVKSTFNKQKYSNFTRKKQVTGKLSVLSKKPISSQQTSKRIGASSSSVVQSRPCNGTNIADPIFNEHSNPNKYSNMQMITNLHSSLKKPILWQSHFKEMHTSNSAAISDTACNESNIIEPALNKHSDPKTHSNLIANKQLATNLPFLPKESISPLQHAKQIHLTNPVAIQNESSCSKTVDVRVLSSAIFDTKNILSYSHKIKTDESNQTKLISSSLNFLQRNDISISRICNASNIPNDSESSSGLLKRQITRIFDSDLNCTILPLKENDTKADSVHNSSNEPQVQDDFIKACNSYQTVQDYKRQITHVLGSNLNCTILPLKENNTKVDSVPNSRNAPEVQDDFTKAFNSYQTVQEDKRQMANASQTNLKSIKMHLKESNKKTGTIINSEYGQQVIDDFIKPNNSCQNLVNINKKKNSQDDKRQITSPSQTNLKFTRLSLEENNIKIEAVPSSNNVPQVQEADIFYINNSCQAIVSISKQKISQDDTDIPKKALSAKKSISSYKSKFINSSCNSSSKASSLDKTFEKSHRTSKLLKRNHQFQKRHSIEEIKRCSSESVSIPVLRTPIIHLLKNTKDTLTIIPVENAKAEYEKDNTLKSISLSRSSLKNSCSLQITLKNNAVEEHSKSEDHDSITDITDCQNAITDSAEASKIIPFLNSSISPIILNFDKKPELYEKIGKYVSSAVVEKKPSEPEMSDNVFHTNKPPRIIRQNIVYTDDREAILRLSTLHKLKDDSKTKKKSLKNVKHEGISTFYDNESSVISENMKKSNISSELTIKLEEVHNKIRCWPEPVIALETIGALDKYNVSLPELVIKENYLSTSKNEPLNKSKVAEISERKIPLSQNLKKIPEKIASHYEILTNASNAFNTQNSDKNKSNINLNPTSHSNSKPVSVKATNPPSISTAKMMENIISCPEKTQLSKNNSRKLPPSLLNSLQKNGISLNCLQKYNISVTNVGNDSKDDSEILNINRNKSQNNLKNEEFFIKDNYAKVNKVNQEKNIPQIKINCIESNNVSRALRINQIYTRIPYKRKIPASDADENVPNKTVCIRKSWSSPESMLLSKSSNSISKFAPIDKTNEESQNKNYDRLVKSLTRSLLSQNQNKVEGIKEWSIKSVSPVALLHTKVVSPVKISQEPVSSISVQNIMAVNRKFDILKRYLLSNSEKNIFSSSIPSMNTTNSPSKIKEEDSSTNFNVTFDVSGASDNTSSLDSPLLTTVMDPVNNSDLHNKDSSTLIEMKPSLPKISCNLSLSNQPADVNKKNIVDFTHDREASFRMRSLCDPKYHAENMEAKLKSDKQIGISPYCQKQSLVIPEKKEDISLEITIKIKDVNKKIGPLERTGIFNEHIITNSYLPKPVAEKIDFTTTYKNEPLVKVEEKCFTSSHNSNGIPENRLPHCINNGVCVNGTNEKVCSKTTEKIPPISENMLNDTSFVETIQTNVDNVGVFKTNEFFYDFNKSVALETVKSSQASRTSINDTNDGMINSVYGTGNKTLEIHGINVGSCQAFSEAKCGIYSDHSFLENTHEETDKNKISCGISHVKENAQDVDFFSNNTFMPPSGFEKVLLENTTLSHIENKSVGSSTDNAHKTISSENELRNVNSEENLDLQLLHLLLTEVQNTYGKVFLKNFIENCVKSPDWDNKNDADKSDKSSYSSDVGEPKTLNEEFVLENQNTAQLSKKQKSMNVSTRNMTVSTRNMNVSTRNMNASTRNMNVSTRNMNASTRNMNVSARNMNASTKTLNVPRQNIPNVNNYLKNIQPANSFQKTNSAAQNFVAPSNRTKVTGLPFNKYQILKTDSNAILNRQTSNVSVTSKQLISQQQHFKPIRSSNSAHIQYLQNTKTSPINQLKAFQQSSTKNKSSVNLNHTTQSSSMPVNMKKPNPPSVSNAKTILMKNVISHPAKPQNSPEKLPPSLLNSLQKNGISVSSLQKCGISVTNVGSDSKTNSELLNRQATAVSQHNSNYAKLSVKEKDAKTNAVPQASSVPQVQNDFIKSNSLCQATIRGNKRKVPLTDAGIPNKSICIRKSNSLSANMSLNSNYNSAPKIASVSKTLEKSQNKTFDGTPNSLIGKISSRNQHNVKEIKEWPTKSVSPAVLHTKVVPLVNNPKIVPRENVRAINQKYDTLKTVSLPLNPQKQLVSSSVNKNAVNNYSKPKAQAPAAISKSIVMNSATSSSNTPFLNSSLSVTVVNPNKKFDLCSKSCQPVVSSSTIETKSSQPKISNYLTRKNQPLRTNRKSIDLTNREALLSLLALCEPDDYTDTKDTKVKNAKPLDNKITKGKNVKPSNSKDSKETSIEPIVISLDSENESSVTPEESTKKSNISSKFTIKLKEVYKTIRHWPKPVVVLERINALDNHIVSNTSLPKPVTKKTDILKSKNKLPVTSKTAKKNKGKNEKILTVSQKLKNDPKGPASQCKNSSITLSDVMKYVDEDFNLQPIENSATLLSENKIILSDAVNDDSSKTVQNSVALLSNNKISLSEAVNDDISLKAIENSMASSNKIPLTDTLNDSNCLELVEDSVILLSNNKNNFSEAVNGDVSLKTVENSMTSSNKIPLTDTLNDCNCLELVEDSVILLSNNKNNFSEAVNGDVSLKTVENSMTSNNKISLTGTLNDSNCLELVENSVSQLSNNKITLSEAVNDNVNLKLAENSVTMSKNTNTLSDIVSDNSNLKLLENSVAQFSNNKIILSETVSDDDSLKPVENSVTLSDTVNDNNSLKPVENSVAQFSNNKITLSEAVGDDSLKPVENSVTLSNNTNTLSDTVNDNNSLKPVEISVTQVFNNKITLSETVSDDHIIKPVESSVTLSNNTNTLSDTVNDNNSLKPVESSVAQFSNNKITLSEAVGDDDDNLKPVENSVTLLNNTNALSETVNDNNNLKPIENSVAQLLNNKIILSEVAKDDVSLKPVENSLTLTNSTVTLLDTINDNNSSELVLENSVAQFSNNKITLSETENEDVSLKQTKNSATLSSNHGMIISKAENKDVSTKSVENSVKSSDRIPVSKDNNEEVSLKPVENSVALISNNKFTLFDTVNDNIGLTPAEISVAQLSNNKSALSEVENENINLKLDDNSAATLSSNNRIISETKNKNVSLKPMENSVTLISNNKSILSDMVKDNINLEPVEHSVAQLSSTGVILSETVDDVILKTIGNSMGQLSSNSVSLSEVVNDDISLKPVVNTPELLSDNSMTILDELSDTFSLKPIKSIKSTLSEDVLVKSVHTDDDDFTSDVSATEKLFHDTAKSDSSEIVKNLLTSTISIVETFDVMMNDISVNGNKNFENNEMSLGSCKDFIRTISGICSDLSSLESMCKETTKDQILHILNSTNKNIQAAAFISKESSAVSSDLATELYNDNANYSAEQSAVSVFISDMLKKVESMLADDETITEVQCKSSDNVMNTSEVIPVLCQKDDSLINHGLLLIDDKTNCSTDNVINNILSPENEQHAGNSVNNSHYKQNLPSTKVQEISDNDIDENLSNKHVESPLFDDKCDVDNLSYENNKDDLNVTLNEAHSDQVTSPKLSLKRNRTELTPDRKHERSGVENVSKKIKFNESVLSTELSNKKPETAISTDITPTISVDVVPSTSFASATPVIDITEEEPVLIVDDDADFQMISSINSDAPICNILEERKEKLIRILDFAASLMPPDTSDEEKKIIANRLVKQLDSAQQTYVESENFNFLLDISLEKIKMKPKGVFTFLNEIKGELKKHKKENKKSIKGSTEDNKISLTDDSISKDIFIDSTSSLPSKDKVALSDALQTNFNFASRLKDYFKVPEKQEPDSASCSSLTSESTKFFSSIKNINDSGSNLQTAANSNTKLVSDDLVTNDSSSSVIALGWHSVKSSDSQSLYNHMSKKFKSAENNSTSSSKTAILESTSFPVSGNDHESKKVDLSSQQTNRRKSIDESGSNLQTCTNSNKKLVYDHFVTNEFSSSAIASAVGLCSKELKTSKLPSLKDSSKEKLNSTEVAYGASTSGIQSSTSIPEHGLSRNNVNREFDLSSLPSTSRCHSPLDKFLSKNDSSFKMSRSSSSDSLPADRRTLLEKKEDDRNAKRIKKLEKLLKELDRAIKKCQQEDLSLDDMDKPDSAYLQENRYKKRFVATYKLLCKLKRVPARTGRIIEKKFHYQGSRYSVINKAVEKLIDSKKVHEKFPDYNEVINVIKQVQDRDDLGFNEVDISNEAKRVFEDIGEQLKERRWRDQRELMGCYLTDNLDLDEDPAERDDRLKKTLEENSKIFNESINKIIDHYVEKQQQTPAGENDEEDDDAEEDDEKDDEEEETVANNDDSDDLPGTAPASPENIGGAPVVNIIERDDDDIEIINYSDKSTDPEGEIKEKQTFTVNKPNISQSILLEDSESSEDLPSLQELVDKSKIGS